MRQLSAPRFRYPALTIESTSQLSIHCTRSIGIIAQIHGEQTAVSERLALRECPQRGLQRFDHIAYSLNLWRVTALKRSTSNLVDLRYQRIGVPIARNGTVADRKEFFLADSSDSPYQ
jgi:hypothetical protein